MSETEPTMSPLAAQQASVAYLAQAKLDANPAQAARLLRITGPAETHADFKRIRGAVKEVMGPNWSLRGIWAKRLTMAMLLDAGANAGNGGEAS